MSKDIRELIFGSPLFDNHEHLLPLPDLGAQEDTYLSFVGYATADLEVSLGPNKPKVTVIPSFPSSRTPEFDRVFFSAWKKSRNTGYCRAIETACRDILGLEYREENVEAIGKKLEAIKGGDPARLMEDVLEGKAGIRWIITDAVNMPEEIGEGMFPSFVHANYRDDPLLVAPNRDTILEREARWDRSIHSLDDLIKGFMDSISQCLATGRVTAFKIGLAYSRGLDFGYPTKAGAEEAFNRLMYVKGGEKVLRANERLGLEPGRALAVPLLSGDELRPLHDYLVHRYIQRASDEGKPVQIHTGYLAGIQRDLRNINPMQLVPILLKYQTTRFDLFHAGWPYTGELAAIGKNYPNVWISLCWAWAMNPIVMERALDEWLDCVPYNKIIGFGGDTQHPLASYGYALQAREGIARVFERRIERGDMDRSLAEEAARAILLTNGCELHGLKAL